MTDKPTYKALENLFVEETGFDIDDFPAAIFDFARAVLAKWGQPVVAGEPQPSAEGPPELWLQLHGDCAEPELSEPVDYTAGDVTWCWHSIHDSDVRYVRADLATTPQPTQPQAGAVPLTDEYPALVCDYCGALTPDPWHSSGMLHGKMSKHIHSCDACAARGAQDTREPLTPERVKEIVRGAGYDQCGIPDTERAAFINGLRHGEREHGIKGGQHVS